MTGDTAYQSDDWIGPEVPVTPRKPLSRGQRLQRVLWWTLGLLALLVVAFFIAVPPQRPVSIAGWTPACPELEVEPWRGVLLPAFAVEAGPQDDPHLRELWYQDGDRLRLGLDRMWGPESTLYLYDWSAEGSHRELVLPDMQGEGTLGRPGGLETWSAGERLWQLAGEQVGEVEMRWYLLAIDRVTWQEVQRVPLPMPASIVQQASSLTISRLPTQPGQPWYFLVKKYIFGHQFGTPRQDLLFLFALDPATGAVSRAEVLPDPGVPQTMRDAERYAFDCWADQGPVYSGYWTSMLWHPDISQLPAGPLVLRPSRLSPLDPPARAKRPKTPVRTTGWGRANAQSPQTNFASVRIVQEYDQFGFDRLTNTALRLDFGQDLKRPTTPAQKQWLRMRFDASLYALSVTMPADDLLEHHYAGHILRLRDNHLTAPWLEGPQPLPAELDQSLRAALSFAPNAGLSGLQVLRAFPQDDDTTLFVQIVVADGLVAGQPDGLLRIGRLTRPSDTIEWLGFAPLPEGFHNFRELYRLELFATELHWLIGLSAENSADRERRYGAWWTRIPYPTGYVPAATGALTELPPWSTHPCRELDPDGVAVEIPLHSPLTLELPHE